MNRLSAYLRENGILLCNQNPELPALEDIGCTWRDMTEAMDAHELFYCKAFRKRATYLSPEAYRLLKSLRGSGVMPRAAETIYRSMEGNPSAETDFWRRISLLPAKDYREGMDFLLQNLYVTAHRNGTWKNENWSAFCYGTAEEWEKLSPNCYSTEGAEARLRELLARTMPKRTLDRFLTTWLKTGG